MADCTICRCCKNKINKKILVKGCRVNDGRNIIRNTPYNYKKTDIMLYECENCNHVQTEFLLPDNYYQEYDDGAGKLQYFGNLGDREPKLKRLQDFSEKNYTDLSFLEIGSGGGYDLITASKYFKRVEGIEPSIVECKIAQKNCENLKNIKIHNGYFGNYELKKKYSAVALFQVLEHIEDVEKMLNDIYNTLFDKGVVLINVPNGQYIMDYSLFHQILNEHINYFTPYSIITACKNVGFEILELMSDDKAMEIDIYIRKNENKADLNVTQKRLESEINNTIKKYKNFAIYGAGAKSHPLVDLIENKELIANIYDGDKRKESKYIAGLNIPIEQPGEKINKNDGILIVAASYTDEIIKLLKENYNYSGDLYYFDDNFNIIKYL